MGKLTEVIVVNSIGTKRMTFRTQMTREEFFAAMNDQGRVFQLEMRSWNAETGETEIALVPGNGVMALYDHCEPPMEEATEGGRNDASKMSDLREFIRKYFRNLNTDSSPDQIAEMFGLDVTRCRHPFGRAVKGIFAQFILESFGPPVDSIESPALPPEGSELG